MQEPILPTLDDSPAPARRRRSFVLFGAAAVATAGILLFGGVTEAGRDADSDLPGYELVFDENFDSLDVSGRGPGTRWIAHTPWNGDFGDALFVDPEPGFPFQVEDGVLRIEARKGEDGIWRSGLLSSADPSGEGFHLKYGYFEIRQKLPPGPGVWPAFWLICNNGPDSSLEIDAMEYYGHEPTSYRSVVRVWPKKDTVEDHVVDQLQVLPEETSLTDSFHTIGVSVEPDWIVFYHDRKEMSRTPTPVEHTCPMFILFNLALGSGFSIENTPDPSYMYVDYVRAYRRLDK